MQKTRLYSTSYKTSLTEKYNKNTTSSIAAAAAAVVAAAAFRTSDLLQLIFTPQSGLHNSSTAVTINNNKKPKTKRAHGLALNIHYIAYAAYRDKLTFVVELRSYIRFFADVTLTLTR